MYKGCISRILAKHQQSQDSLHPKFDLGRKDSKTTCYEHKYDLYVRSIGKHSFLKPCKGWEIFVVLTAIASRLIKMTAPTVHRGQQ